MHIGLFGYGKMGKMVEKVALDRGHSITEKIDSADLFTGNADAYIEFTLPDAVLQNVQKACDKKAPLIIGTTGWLTQKDTVEHQIKEAGIPVIYGGNFSLGVNLFWRSLQKVSKEFSAFADEYDVFTHEFHHNKKKDSPSGTALTTADIILENFPSKTKRCDETLTNRAIESDELHVTATRGGSIPGTHSVYFDSPFDTVEFTHRARTREGFALGAVLAAENIHKLPAGLHHFPDIFDELFR